jgi:perosamine synthetase
MHEHSFPTRRSSDLKYKGRYAGTLADMGVYSLNYHKTIHCGEGGVVVTNNDDFAERLQLIRNHAEVVVKNKGVKNLVNMIGFNYRMTEIEAAIAIEQLKKLEKLLILRIKAAEYLTKYLSEFSGIVPPHVRSGVRHGYYVYPITYNAEDVGISREKFVAALNAEGIPMVNGYVEPLYLEPCYQQMTAFGKDGFPFTYPGYKGKVNYRQGICPVTERMYYKELMYTNICHANAKNDDLSDFIVAFGKLFDNLKELQS